MSSTQTGPPRSAPRKARATSPPPAPGGKTFGGARGFRASGTPRTLLPAIHVAKFASSVKSISSTTPQSPSVQTRVHFAPTRSQIRIFGPTLRRLGAPHGGCHKGNGPRCAMAGHAKNTRARWLGPMSRLPFGRDPGVPGGRWQSRRDQIQFWRAATLADSSKRARGADRLISRPHRPRKARSSRAGRAARVEGKNQWIKHSS